MEQSEQGGFDRFLDMHMYMTSALRKTDVKAIGLQMALDLIHKKQKRDLITGLKTKTQAGRPVWEKVYYTSIIEIKLVATSCPPLLLNVWCTIYIYSIICACRFSESWTMKGEVKCLCSSVDPRQ